MNTVWDVLQDLACRGDALEPVAIEGVQIFNLAEYLDMLLPQLDAVMRETAGGNHQSWKGSVGHSRQADVAGALPQLAACLRRFAAEGQVRDGLNAASTVMLLLLREMLRRGLLPVLYPLGKLPVTMPSAPFVVG